ncbi:MAG: GFA family protein [Hydromonas sp.]|nr:GFA family protein [Hydromonas sp.]MBP6294279.1 GFA family protein [Hydromonas sp.]
MSETHSINTGTCLCGAVAYEISGNLGLFQYCHCSRCRKVTGSAFAANLFVAPTQFKWTQGEDKVGRYELENAKHFASSFCTQCGSNLPWLTKTGKAVVVPAGTLNQDPNIEPKANTFYASRAPWEKCVSELPAFDELPVKT